MKSLFTRNTEKFVDQQVYAVYDQIAGTFQQPLFAPNHLVLAREFEGLFMDPNHAKNTLVTNPEGYSLSKIGEYDRRSGTLTGLPPEHVFTMAEIKNAVLMRQQPSQTLRDVSQ